MAKATYQHKEINSTIIDNGTENFGFTDNQGRQIGTSYAIREIKSRPYQNGDGLYYLLPFSDNAYYSVTINATRDGNKYGATQSSKHIRTLECAHNEVTRHIAASRKRYAKKYT